ncbi:MAG TPA: CAP domain-containing protein [Planctomycetota bacterium]|nr:CAP domain-containing protein [Planctomycetota bacterium]
MARLAGLIALWAVLAGGLWAGEAPAKEAGEAFEAMGRQMAELVNRDRAEHKAPPLAYHKGLAAVARAHCLDMKTHRFFAHESPRTGSVQDRVAGAGIPNRGVGENLARATTADSAQRNLMLSPKHKENILSPQFTHIGVGFLRGDDGWLFCTQVFMRQAPAYDVEAIREQIIEGVNKARLAKGLRRLLPDDTLAAQALAHSERAAKLGKADPLWLDKELNRRDKRWRLHIAAYFLTDKPEQVAESDVALSKSPDHFGVGVVQSPLNSKAAGALWVTLLCAQKK